MKLIINNIRSLSKVDIDFDSLTLITGANQSGKTTLLNTVSALMLGEKNLYGATAKDASPVIKTGTETASAQLNSSETDDDDIAIWSSSMIWPRYDASGHGVAPPANEITMGRVDPAGQYDAKQWADFIRKICNAGGLKIGAVKAEMEKLEASDDQVTRVMTSLKSGWDDAAKHCETERRRARRDWESATGEKFGATKSDWQADGYVPDDDPEKLAVELEALKAELTRATVSEEMAGGDVDDLKSKILAMGEESNKIGGKIELIRKRQADLEDQIRHYPTTDPLSCPDCGVLLELKAGKLEPHEPSKYVRGSDEHNALISELDAVKADYDELAQQRGTITANIEADNIVFKKLSEAREATRDKHQVGSDLKAIERRLTAATISVNAHTAFNEWSFWDQAMNLVGPTGLRLQATIKALKELNPRIEAIAAMLFPDHQVRLDGDDIGVTLLFDSMSYKTLVWSGDPNSYAMRIKIMFQILEAQRLGNDAFILIDRFDTLEKRHKSGVLNCLHKLGITAIIGQMANEKPPKDILNIAGVGGTFWINDGKLEAV